MRRFSAILITILAIISASAQVQNGRNAPAVYKKPMADDVAANDTVQQKPSFFKRLLATITEGNVDHTRERAVDLSFAVYPSYSHEPGLGLGGAFTALYRVDRNDTLPNPSDFFVSFNASLRGFFQIYAKGNNLFPDGRTRINYVMELYRMPLHFWGINPIHNLPEAKYDRYMFDIQANVAREIIDNFYVGARIRCNYTKATDIPSPEYIGGAREQYYVTGVGLLAEYDNRDNLLSPTRGIHLLYRPTLYFKPLGSAGTSFWNHTFIANAYTPLWRGAVLGFDAYGSFNSDHTPWTMREMIASDGIRMRGYYMGSYIANNQIALQAEYRQHVYKRLGFTLWGGVATLFDKFGDFSHHANHPKALPNFGVGLRFEIKKNANLRLDWGFGRHDSGIIFAFGEAF